MDPARLLPVAAGALLAGVALLPLPAEAAPPCGRGWRKGEWCGGPAVVVAPPPPVLAAPSRPGIGLHVEIPLR
jgi:hypothetical protein